MGNSINYLSCGDFALRYSFEHSDTKFFFGEYLETPAESVSVYDIHLTPKTIEEYRWLVADEEESLPFMEFQAMMIVTGNVLLTNRCALFHGAALLWKNHEWILTGPSGTGKTTQLLHWRRLQRELKIINGDKPLLECRNNDSIWVFSSPWRGKEKYGRKGLNAPLGGIILLEQGNENLIERMNPEDAVLPLFTEFVSFPENEDQIKGQSQILQQILDNVPVWKLINLGDEESAILTQKTLADYLEGRS